MSSEDYYSFIEAFYYFCMNKDDSNNLIRYAISGMIPTHFEIRINRSMGHIFLNNIHQFEKN